MTDVLLTLLSIPLSPSPHTWFSIFQLFPESLRQPSKPPLCPAGPSAVQLRKSEHFTALLALFPRCSGVVPRPAASASPGNW